MSEYDDLVEKLTRAHDVHYQSDNGTETITLPGLLEQLREEVLGGTNRGGAAGSKTRLPMNAPAADLYALIDRQISEVWAKAFQRIPNADGPETLLATWSALVDESQYVIYSTPETRQYYDDRGKLCDRVIWIRNEAAAINLLRRWVRSIEDLFDPPRQAPIIAACIQCGQREVWRDSDGQKTKQTALVFVRDRETGESTEAKCQSCGESWMPDQFGYLAKAIASNEKRLRDTPKDAVAASLQDVQ